MINLLAMLLAGFGIGWFTRTIALFVEQMVQRKREHNKFKDFYKGYRMALDNNRKTVDFVTSDWAVMK